MARTSTEPANSRWAGGRGACCACRRLRGDDAAGGSIAGSDVTVYATYGTKMLDGAVPYRDFAMEYPPGAAVMFVLPATRAVAGGSTDNVSWMPLNIAGRRYYRGFESLVVLLMGAIVVLTALTLRAMARPNRTVLLSLAVVASSPLLIGQVLTERFDVWPAALTSAALAASIRGRYRVGGTLLGLGAAAKIYPAILLPVLVIVAGPSAGRPRSSVCRRRRGRSGGSGASTVLVRVCSPARGGRFASNSQAVFRSRAWRVR